jgi:hypothetical protein
LTPRNAHASSATDTPIPRRAGRLRRSRLRREAVSGLLKRKRYEVEQLLKQRLH